MGGAGGKRVGPVYISRLLLLTAIAGMCMSCVDKDWPKVACTPDELGRLKAAYVEGGERGAVVARVVEQADEALGRTISFPPEGGQHNQWYQCDRCQIALKTVDDSHHECPKCSEVYTGYPYDNVIFERKLYKLTSDMNRCAWAFALTDKVGYAQRARDILIEFSERYSQYPLHSANQGKREDKLSKSSGHVFEQTLNEAAWTQDVVETYDLIRKSDLVSSEDHASVETFLRELAANIAKHKAGKSNWQTYHNSAFMLIGGILNDEQLIKQAIEDPENGHLYQMDVSVLDGGMWYENSWSYHFYTLGAVERIIETGRRLGIDLYDDPRVKSMYTVAMDYVMADGTLPRFGDAVTTGTQGRRYESAYNYWKDDAFLAVLPEGPSWDSIMFGREEASASVARDGVGSLLLEGAGHAILRVSGDKGPASAVLTFGPFGGFHGHFDKLSFVYFALGHELGYDPGRARSQAYRLPVHKNWYRATTSHNTVLVDRTSQEGVEGERELFVENESIAAAAARVDSAYEGVVHRRLLILRPDFAVVADVLDGEEGSQHTFDWLYHNPGSGIASSSAEQASPAPEGQGFDFLEDVRTGFSAGATRATVTMPNDDVDIVVNGQPGSKVLVATGVGESVLDRVPMLMVTREGSNATFGAVIEPRQDRAASRISDITVLRVDASVTITVTMVDGSNETYTFNSNDGSFHAQRTEANGTSTDLI
jgi:hypothetical protein